MKGNSKPSSTRNRADVVFLINGIPEDGTTLKMNYTLAPSHLRVDREVLEEEFLNNADAAGVSDPDELNRILDKTVNLKAMLKSRQRVNHIAKSVSEHFQSNVEPMGFKAFLVTVDREACALYKQALEKYLPTEPNRRGTVRNSK